MYISVSFPLTDMLFETNFTALLTWVLSYSGMHGRRSICRKTHQITCIPSHESVIYWFDENPGLISDQLGHHRIRAWSIRSKLMTISGSSHFVTQNIWKRNKLYMDVVTKKEKNNSNFFLHFFFTQKIDGLFLMFYYLVMKVVKNYELECFRLFKLNENRVNLTTIALIMFHSQSTVVSCGSIALRHLCFKKCWSLVDFNVR